ncbi:MAG: SPASM domain-containing protein [Saprospiraceae bacterium]|jgi:radical SAM protein with 4Fe4S-binding SPASM domain|nr:SPASM domain-containing protein [Candidatus Parvibacillus calidus]MBX2937392.1 SPASM domain-containing protein [Saprospiraceae bacterium]MBX7179214.1 SPASM domain-containing protein [Saprospiraceae bacterium]MCB0591118.1 SPASM domain-containing protein [Saprospiraceae bacterium]MCO5283989.1 SPASM domain-containing protein [Saprospiraceae bacterium]
MNLFATDTWRFLSLVRPAKVLNAAKVVASYYLTRWTGKAIQWGLPFTISIEPTTACNLRCPECPSGLRAFSRPTGNLKEDFFRKIIDELGNKLFYLIFYFQGEPYINPKFLEMVHYASQKNIYTITSTNGHFLDDENARKTIESGLSRIIISVDGTTQEVYQSYRREGNLETVLNGARNLVRWKNELNSPTPHIIFQFLVVKPNEHQIPEIYRLAKEIGVDEVKLKTAQIYDYEQGNELIPSIDKYSRYRKQANGTYRIKNQLLNHCWKLWHSCVITWNGTVVPCCFDKDAKYMLGDLKKDSFRKIWYGKLYDGFRRKILAGRDQIDICRNCTEGCKVWESE